MALEAGTRLGSYEILSELGLGGMAAVYRARDWKLGRIIAIKLIRTELAADPERVHRFELEARAASALNHPNIVTIYEIGEHAGKPYIAMEYVEGKTLREALTAGPLPLDELIRYATQLAEGLAKAHRAGIVHRDLKPENIVISEDGYVKILDFGLAKLVPQGAQVESAMRTLDKVETREGVILGTVHYMSPEQAAGRSVDFRSDQFSLGTILYEMATGRRPFARDTAAETLTAILREEPEPLTTPKTGVAATVARVIARCLAKDPAERYASTWDIAKDLHREELETPAAPAGRRSLVAVGVVGLLAMVLVTILGLFASDIREWLAREPAAPKIESIAVLPLENLSGDTDQEYFSDGMTDELISQLAQIQSLRVISRTSIMQYKGARKPLPEIGRELDVDAIVEGTVRRSEGRVRITAQLIRAETDEHLWAQSFERELRDVLVLQSEVARAIAGQVRTTLSPEEGRRLAESRRVDPAAHEAFLKGRFHSEQATAGALEKSVEFLQTAIDTDPTYAPAYARLAWVYATEPLFFLLDAREGAFKARAMAERALSLDGNLEDAHVAVARAAATYEHHWNEAENSFRRALDVNPSSARAHSDYGWFLTWIGRHDDAIAEQRAALALDPLSSSVAVRFGGSLTFARRYGEAIELLKETLLLHPGYGFGYGRLCVAYSLEHMYEEALEACERFRSLDDTARGTMYLSRLYALMGREARARELMSEVEQANLEHPPAHMMARVYAALGANDTALDWLEKGYEIGDPNMVLIKVNPDFDSLRSEPRFQDLLRRMNFLE